MRRGTVTEADDVREALADESDFTPSTEQVRSHYVFDQSNVWRPERGRAFDRWLAAEVRPRGTVTDTDRSAINAALIEILPLWTDSSTLARKALLDGIVGALEAARKAEK